MANKKENLKLFLKYLAHLEIFSVCMCTQSLSQVGLFETLWTVAHQAPLSMEFFKQEYRRGLLFPSPGDLPDPGIEPVSPAPQANVYRLSHQESPFQVCGGPSTPTLPESIPYSTLTKKSNNHKSLYGQHKAFCNF